MLKKKTKIYALIMIRDLRLWAHQRHKVGCNCIRVGFVSLRERSVTGACVIVMVVLSLWFMWQFRRHGMYWYRTVNLHTPSTYKSPHLSLSRYLPLSSQNRSNKIDQFDLSRASWKMYYLKAINQYILRIGEH